MRHLWRSRPGAIGSVIVAVVVAVAVVGMIWTPHDPSRVVPREKWRGISADHWFGTDGAGKDLFSQVLAGARTTLTVVIGAVVIAALVGVVLGVVSALVPRSAGVSIAYLLDVFIALPTLVLALVLVAALESSLWTVALAIGLGSGVILARVVRAQAESVLTRDYIVAAHSSGCSTWRIAWRHVLPNIGPTVVVQLSVIAAFAVLSEAALSFLGLTPVSTPSWGRMLEGLQQSVTVHPGAIVFPGTAVVLATLGFNLLGDGIRDALDPQLRRRTPPGPGATLAVAATTAVDVAEQQALEVMR